MKTRRIASRGRPVITASSCCIEWVACDDVHTVSLPSWKSATAHDGPIVACVCTAKSYVALTRFALPSSAALASPTFWVTSSFATGRLRQVSKTVA